MKVKTLREKLINELIDREGGFVDDPSDSGGATNFGITVAVARKYGFNGPMMGLPLSVAKAIYLDRYWNRLRLDQIAMVSPKLAEELFDTGVNMGTGRAGTFLQRALNVFNPQATLDVDGRIGAKTIDSLDSFLRKRGKEGDIILVKAVDSLQGNFYIELAERRVKDKRFVFGWFRNRIR